MRIPRVAARIAELRAERRVHLIAEGDEELEQLWEMTQISALDFVDGAGQPIPIHELPFRVAAAVKSIRQTRYGRVIEVWDKLRAIEIRLRAFGRLVDRHELSVPLEEIVARANQGEPMTAANSLESGKVAKQLGPGTEGTEDE